MYCTLFTCAKALRSPGSIYSVDNILISVPATRVSITSVRFFTGNSSVSKAFKTKKFLSPHKEHCGFICIYPFFFVLVSRICAARFLSITTQLKKPYLKDCVVPTLHYRTILKKYRYFRCTGLQNHSNPVLLDAKN